MTAVDTASLPKGSCRAKCAGTMGMRMPRGLNRTPRKMATDFQIPWHHLEHLCCGNFAISKSPPPTWYPVLSATSLVQVLQGWDVVIVSCRYSQTQCHNGRRATTRSEEAPEEAPQAS